MDIEERIRTLAERWFLCEPALFAVYCIHKLAFCTDMNCPVRIGKGRIEFNPHLLEEATDLELDQRMRAELIRVLLKHPYGRQPSGCSPIARRLGSDCVLADHYILSEIPMMGPADFELEPDGTYEGYARQIQEQLPHIELGGDFGQNDDSTGLWQDDELTSAEINRLIGTIQNWGSMPGKLVESIEASTRATIDYNKVLQGFRASVLSSQRRLTRMRPNRRMGFEQMGSQLDFTTRMLVAVDVSGSIPTTSLQHFYSVINKAFRYGIKEIDVLQFDSELKGEPVRLTKARTDVEVKGRGGTCFQPVIDYAQKHPYDGLVIMTDGYAPEPKLPDSWRTPLLWVCMNENCLKHNQEWMSKMGRTMLMNNI